MTNEQIKHMEKIASLFSEQMKKKYEAGQVEHGGDLWKKKGIIDFSIEEAIDQVVYLLTLKEQLDSGKYYELTLEDN